MDKTSPTDKVTVRITNQKQTILEYLANTGNETIPALVKKLNISPPKVTKLVKTLIQDGLIRDYGKVDSTGGRKPNMYGLVPDSSFFMGVDVKHDHINIGLSDFQRNLVKVSERQPYQLDNTEGSLDMLCKLITEFIDELDISKRKILGICINLSGRINHETGHSYSFFFFNDKPLVDIIEERIGIRVFIENDTRAMAYGEFSVGVVDKEQNVLFLNLDYGIGLGILMNGQLYYGKSGYAGEFGHIPLFDNEYLCRCGKKGCLETEAAGWALTRKFKERLKEGATSILLGELMNPEDVTMHDIIIAARNEDVLAIELIAQIGENLGRGIALLMNVLNPELIVLGGSLSLTGDYIKLPVLTAINKYSLNLVNSDTKLKMSVLGESAGIIGACLLCMNRFLSSVQS